MVPLESRSERDEQKTGPKTRDSLEIAWRTQQLFR